jgi:hypothetical protein
MNDVAERRYCTVRYTINNSRIVEFIINTPSKFDSTSPLILIPIAAGLRNEYTPTLRKICKAESDIDHPH